jgi:hypothetical protein
MTILFSHVQVFFNLLLFISCIQFINFLKLLFKPFKQ